MGSLDLIVTHYKTPWEIGKPFFDMIGLQRNINWKDVGVILVNDGEESRLPDELFKDYPYRVTNLTIPHGGVSRARNTGIDASKADWVMICDFDDQFCSTLGLNLLFSAISDDDKDMYWTHFLEEIPDERGAMKIISHDRDLVFIHGKMFRKKWLDENHLRFCNGLTLHEDVYLNTISQAVAKPERIGEIKTGYYLWCCNPNSVGRSYKDRFVIETYDHLMKQRNMIVKDLQKRGLKEQVKIHVCKTVVDAYYDFQSRQWLEKGNEELRKKNERWFCTFLKKYAKVFAESDSRAIAKLAEGSRSLHVKNGHLVMECITMRDWIHHMMKEVKPFDFSVLDVEP